MLTAQKIMPVVLVSVAAILALTFMLTYFANQQFTADVSTQFTLNPLLQKGYSTNKQLSISTKETCIFTNPGINCNPNAVKTFCNTNMQTPNAKSSLLLCTQASITCQTPCGIRGATCNSNGLNGKFSIKAC